MDICRAVWCRTDVDHHQLKGCGRSSSASKHLPPACTTYRAHVLGFGHHEDLHRYDKSPLMKVC